MSVWEKVEREKPPNNVATFHFEQPRGPNPGNEPAVYFIIGHIASYSRVDNKYHLPGKKEFGNYHTPTLPANLNDGFCVDKKDEETDAAIYPIILSTLHSSVHSLRVHFITFRNNLNKILNTPYNLRDSWKIGAQLLLHPQFGRCISLHIIHEKEDMNEQQRRMCYWGRRFETISTQSACPEPDKEFCTVALAQLNQFLIVLGAEIDCVLPEFAPSNPLKRTLDSSIHNTTPTFNARHFVELKTNRVLTSETARSFYQHKLRTTWIQSMLAGVPLVKFGFRNDEGELQKIEDFPTHSIPQIAKSKGATWEPEHCIQFASRILNFLKTNVKENENYILQHAENARFIELHKTDKQFFNTDKIGTEFIQIPGNHDCECKIFEFVGNPK